MVSVPARSGAQSPEAPRALAVGEPGSPRFRAAELHQAERGARGRRALGREPRDAGGEWGWEDRGSV